MNINLTDIDKKPESVQKLISKIVLAKKMGKDELCIAENGMTDDMKCWLMANDIPYSYNTALFEWEIKLNTEDNE